MADYYYEKRTLHKPIATLAGDIARHVQLRQHLGRSVIVCDSPMAMLSATRKQWMRISRLIQRKRASTLNAEEILRYTRSIMHMQHMRFVAKTPGDDPTAHVFFVEPDEFTTLPLECQSIYITVPLSEAQLSPLRRLPASSLVVTYSSEAFSLPDAPQPRSLLETQALEHWERLLDFLVKRHIHLEALSADHPRHSRALDDALDSLLDASTDFLRLAYDFQQAITLAQPLSTIDAQQQKQFDIVMRLAHRVHSLTPNILGPYLSNELGARDSYFLRDRAAEIDDLLNTVILPEIGEEDFETAILVE